MLKEPRADTTGEKRYLQRESNTPICFTINALRSSRSDDEPNVEEALNGKKANEWSSAMSHEVETLNGMRCWEVVPRPPNTRNLHSRFLLQRKRGENNIIQN